jgi:tight adherence protein C
MIPLLASLMTMVCFTGVALWVLRPKPNRLAVRLSPIEAIGEVAAENEMDRPFSERVGKPLMDAIMAGVKRVAPPSMLEDLDQQLVVAGRPAGLNAASFIALQVGTTILPLLVYVTVVANISMEQGVSGIPYQQMAIAAGLIIFGFLGPRLLISSLTKGRQKKVIKAMPDALDLIVVCVEAGLGLDAALAKVAEETQGPLSMEVRRALMESSMGKLRRNALRDMAARLKVSDLTSFVAALCQADQMGTSLSQVLRAQSAQLRVKRRQRAEQEAMRAPLKMLFPLVFFIFPALFIIILGPAAIGMMDTLVK